MADAKERKILVAVDDGLESMYALSWSLHNLISQTSNDNIILIYAKPPRTVYTSPDGYLFSPDMLASIDKCRNDLASSIIEKAKKICREQGDNEVKVEVIIESGDPRDVICQAADKIHADVLVMGSHGYGLIKRAFLGSVSNHCAQNVKCPVLIATIHPNHSKLFFFYQLFQSKLIGSMAEDDVVAKDRKILVAVDEGEESTNALSWCLKNVISHTSKDTLVLLYAKPPRAVYTSLDGTGYLFSSDILATMDKYSNDVADCVIEKAKRMCREQGDPEVKVEVMIESGDPRDVICQVADKINADVLGILGECKQSLCTKRKVPCFDC
ncbi:hypothetical protein CXB51_029864 [Gossypium anomalum]|uniref:UspA domain-containing protein n=1 Tax=Gossypium anomalum TaxID=47600 RepID=A0A8J5YBI4_9ROSI|nr:hypothetical protein CXB51_029864 [Gossypium anomalum]